MFGYLVFDTELTSTLYKAAMPIRRGQLTNIDESFETTFRALCIEQGIRYESLKISVWGRPSFSETVNGKDQLVIADGNYISELPSGWVEGFEFERVQKITDFFAKHMKVECYINRENRSTIIVCEEENIQKYHFLQVAIPLYFPWYFEGKELTENSKELIRSLTLATPDAYNAIVSKIARNRGAVDGAIKNKVESIMRDASSGRIRELEGDLGMINNRLESLYRDIDALRCKKEETNALIFGLKYRGAGENNEQAVELSEFLISNKSVEVLDINNDCIDLLIKTPLMFFDEEMAEAVIENTNSYIYQGTGTYFTREEKRLLAGAIFVEQELGVNMCAQIRYKVSSPSGLQAVRMDNRSAIYGYMQNPHLFYYDCFGDYSRKIRELLDKGDVVSAINQSIPSVGTLNMSDSTVMARFFADLFSSEQMEKQRCIVLPNGDSVRPEVAIKYLKGELEIGEENKAE